MAGQFPGRRLARARGPRGFLPAEAERRGAAVREEEGGQNLISHGRYAPRPRNKANIPRREPKERGERTVRKQK